MRGKTVRFRGKKGDGEEIQESVSLMRKTSPLAIFCADLHLSHRPPIARSGEDWYETMKGYLRQLELLTNHVPIICAGDIFDKWNAPAELINFCLKHLPAMYAVPGQHDIPNHSYDDLHKSAFWTLVEAKKITLLKSEEPVGINTLSLHGFPYGEPLGHLENPHGLTYDIAVVHRYVWTRTTCYLGASYQNRLKPTRKELKGFHLAVFGDNHKPFYSESKEEGYPNILNCGGFMRRTSDQKNYRPCVWLLNSNHTIERHYLDVSKDRFLEVEEIVRNLSTKTEYIDTFIEELQSLGDAAIDFGQAIERAMETRNVPSEVGKIILKALEK